jgi:hypothetical protein
VVSGQMAGSSRGVKARCSDGSSSKSVTGPPCAAQRNQWQLLMIP